MSSIDHVTIRVSDLAASCDFYRQVFELLAFPGERHDAAGFHEWNDFSITHADAQHPPTHGLHIAFAADSREQIDAWWHALTHDDGRPGPRPQYGRDYYGAFIRDDDGNSVEAVRHTTTNRANGLIDHLWIRVADLQPVKRFYTTVAPTISLRPRDLGDRLQLAAEGATFSFLQGAPTANLHLALGVSDKQTVADFHTAGLAAGGRDNGRPGERPHYHRGYYAAYLLDPADTNLEAVFHNRSITST